MKNILKRALATFLVVAIVLCSAPLSGLVGLELPDWLDFSIKSSAATYSGSCGDNLTWNLDTSTGVLSISGTGNMKNFIDSTYVPWISYRKYIYTVIIDNGVTSIGKCAFSRCASLISIIIPDSVTSIGGSAFEYCTSLTSITIPNGVTSIDGHAFAYCNKITSITIPDSVTSIDDTTFAYCESLENVIIGDSVTSIGDYAFRGCSSLAIINIPNSVSTIYGGAFYDCISLASIIIPESVTKIETGIFYGCTNLTNIIVDDKNTCYSSDEYGVLFNKDKSELKQYPIGNIKTSYIVPNSVTSIGYGALEYCKSLTSITLPDSVTYIGNYAFSTCDSLKDVYYAGTEEQWNAITIVGNHNECLTNATIHFNSSGNSTNTGNIQFNGSASKVKYTLSYSDDDFFNPSTDYNHNLAINSMCLALSTMVEEGYYDNASRTDNQPEDGIKLLKDMSFDGDSIEIYNYYDKPTSNSIACIIGHKNIDDYTVIAVGVRSGGYENEWSGNANVGDTSNADHEGFAIASDKVIDYIRDYIDKYYKDFNIGIKFWITGYSRGGAVANLVGSSINDGCLDDYYDIKKSNTFVYTFEAPCNTTNSNAKCTAYNNIFNLINRLDIVPQVPLRKWGFTRYGRDAYLPSRETYSPSKYEELLSSMQEKYKQISSGKEYSIDFSFYEFDLSSLATGFDYGTSSFIKKNTMGMGAFLNNFLDVVAKLIVPNRKVYHNNYEDTLERVLPKVMQVDTTGMDYSEDGFWEYFRTSSSVTWDSVIGIGQTKMLLAAILAYYFNIPINDAYDAVSISDNLLLAAIAHPNYTLTLIKNLSNKPEDDEVAQNFLFYQHEPRVNFAWVASLDETTVEAALDVETYRIAKYHCPVDIEVYDSNGNLVGKIVNDVPQEVENGLSVYIDENGAKCFCLPNDEEYTFKVIATDDGQVSCYFEEYNFTTNETITSENFYNIGVENGDVLKTVVEELPNGENKSEVMVYDVDLKEIKSNATVDVENAEKHSVSVQYDKTMSSVATGGGEYYNGEFAQVTVLPTENEIFIGWYIDGECVSTDLQYKFMVEKDVTVVARFEKIDCDISIQTPSLTTIRCKDGIILHANVNGTLPEGAKIVWSTNNSYFKTKQIDADSFQIVSNNNGYTTVTVSIVDADGNILATDSVEMYSKAGFGDKIGGFFRSLFGSTKIYDK